ncbi:deoxyribonuclease TATDN1 isoform X3 [Bemisia tabaci]|nr:PREDICTED: putative deoxyribonuclease TATDN1 isoform X3 [Bemisia tabaci]
MYEGLYRGSQKHQADLKNVLERAWSNGLDKIIITGGSLEESHSAHKLALSDERLFCTVGCHPTRCNEFESSGNPDDYLESLSKLIRSAHGKVVAVGETGLDYDRLQFCSKEIQKKYFEIQLKLSKLHDLPLFLHNRNTGGDFLEILQKHAGDLPKGVVHSFDGSLEEMESLVNLGYYIGINGCSLKTKENLEVVKKIPEDKLLLETDCPWCEVRPTHAGFPFVKTKFDAVKKEKWNPDLMVKSRNEPATMTQILEIVAAIRDELEEKLCEIVYNNTIRLFFNK